VLLGDGTEVAHSPTEPVPVWVNRDQRHAYYAAMSYVDEHIGALLQALRDESVESSTIVAAHSDHGYHLGEHGLWHKASNFENAVRVPLVIKAPGKPSATGRRTESTTELVDLWPTLSRLAGVGRPASAAGDDLSPLFDDPTQTLKHAAYHQFPACRMRLRAAGRGADFRLINQTRKMCNQLMPRQFDFMGYSMRTARWRYTLWLPWDQERLEPLWRAEERDCAQELYDHAGDDASDMDRYENVNLAAERPDVTIGLRAQLEGFFSIRREPPRSQIRQPP